MTTVEILKAAREFLSDPDHWTQDDTYGSKDDDCVCAMGALYLAANGWGSALPVFVGAHAGAVGDAHRAIAAAIHSGSGHGELTIAEWNDSPDTTHADVLDVFDRAIAARVAA